MKLEVVNSKGEKTGRKVELSDDIFGIEPNDHVIYLDVKRYLNNQRQGTHKAKQRNEIHGSTRKIRKQKGGGGARAGSIKNPLFRHGGRIFGPQPRDYTTKLNKKVKILARKSALAYKAKENKIIIVEDFDFEQPRTKSYIDLLKALELNGTKTLLLLNENRENVIKSARNLPDTEVNLANSINTYNILHATTLLVMEGSIGSLNENLK